MKSRRNSVSSVYEIKSRKPTMSDLSPVSPHLHLIISSQEHGRPTVHSLLGSSAVASEQGVTALLQRTGVCVFSRRHQQLKEDKFRSVGKVITLQGMESDRLNILRSHKHRRDQDKTQSDNQEHSLLMEKIQLKRGKESTAERGYETAKKKNKLSEKITELDHQKAKLSEQMKDKDKELASLQLQLGQVEKGIVPKYTVRRLSRQGNGPGEVWRPLGLTINQNGQVVVSDYGDGTQPGSVKTVTADTAQIISTITFHGLPNTFTPTDVKMSKNNLYYIADNGNNCILVCDAKSRLKQIIDIGEVSVPEICLGPDNTVFVGDYNGRVIKYSKAGEMISSKQLS
ncbi:uncharacterized protein [Ptychodera flava]|uniref:uncharacterized protein isoform X1 n=1 Tax=Ptychodera flava TaxID=63121 RepID=UPI00396A82BE